MSVSRTDDTVMSHAIAMWLLPSSTSAVQYFDLSKADDSIFSSETSMISNRKEKQKIPFDSIQEFDVQSV